MKKITVYKKLYLVLKISYSELLIFYEYFCQCILFDNKLVINRFLRSG